MSTTVTYNGTTYSIPTSSERGWAALTNYLKDLGTFSQTTGAQKGNVRTVTATPVSVLSTDYTVLVNLTTPGVSIVNLPSGVAKQIYVIADGKGDAATNPITVQSSAAQLIDGAATHVIQNNWGAVAFIFDATSSEWRILSSYVGDSPRFTTVTLSSLGLGVVHSSASGVLSSSEIVNADVSASAAIAYSKLNLSGSIVNADVSASAAIAYSKLNIAGSVVNADVSASAAIAYSKLDLAGSVVNADISASAAIAYSKLDLAGSVVNADVSASAAIAYSKLNLAGSILFSDLSVSFSLPRSSIASGTANHVLINGASGEVSSEATLSKSRGGAGADQSLVTYPSTGVLVTRDAAETLQNKAIDAAVVPNYEDFVENATPATPASGRIRVYAKADKNMYQLDSLGVETQLAVGGGGGGSFDPNTIVTDSGNIVVDNVTGNIITSA